MTRCLLPPDAPEHWCDIRRRTVQIPSPAAGTDWLVRVPVAEAWLIRGLVATLTTSAALGTRVPELRIRDEGVVISRWQAARGQSPSETDHLSIVQGGPAAVPTGAAFNQWGVPAEVTIHPGRILDTNTLGIDVADQWSEIALDVVFELNRGQGAAYRYAQWRRQVAGGMPDTRVESGYQ